MLGPSCQIHPGSLQNARQRLEPRGQKSIGCIAQEDTATVYILYMPVLLDVIIKKKVGFSFLVVVALWTKFPNSMASLMDSPHRNRAGLDQKKDPNPLTETSVRTVPIHN